MRKTRLVRNVNENHNTYEIWGFMLTEKAKRDLRARGVKTDDTTWADVFPNADVVYRFNPDKNKSDVFVGVLQAAKYADGKKTKRLSLIHTNGAVSNLLQAYTKPDHMPALSTFTVNPAYVHRKGLLTEALSQ